jgi:hypothetical protein
LFCFFEERESRDGSRSSCSTRATLYFRSAIGIFTNKFTFGFRAIRFVTFPVAFGLLANSFAFRFGSLTMSHTVRLLANCNTLGTVEHFATFIRTFNFTLRFFTFYIANCIFGFSA